MKVFAEKKGITHYYSDQGKHKVATVFSIKKTLVVKIEKNQNGEMVYYALISNKSKPPKSVTANYNNIEQIKRITTDKDSKDREIKKEIGVKDFTTGDTVTITAKTKGKGFAGTVKRHGFSIGPKSHGSRNKRKPGSIGDTGPQRVLKGKKMPGHMGSENRTIHSVSVVKVLEDKNQIWLNGHIPGPKKSISIIKKDD